MEICQSQFFRHLCPTLIKQSFVFMSQFFIFPLILSPHLPPLLLLPPRGATAPAQASPAGGHWLHRGQRPVAILTFEEAKANGEARAGKRPMARRGV